LWSLSGISKSESDDSRAILWLLASSFATSVRGWFLRGRSCRLCCVDNLRCEHADRRMLWLGFRQSPLETNIFQRALRDTLCFPTGPYISILSVVIIMLGSLSRHSVVLSAIHTCPSYSIIFPFMNGILRHPSDLLPRTFLDTTGNHYDGIMHHCVGHASNQVIPALIRPNIYSRPISSSRIGIILHTHRRNVDCPYHLSVEASILVRISSDLLWKPT
jgi:hypothetical protein